MFSNPYQCYSGVRAGQLCAILSSGIEGAIHAMHSLFVANQDLSSGWGSHG